MNTCPAHIRNRAYTFNQFIRPEDVNHIAWQLRPNISSRQQAITQAFNYVTSNIRYTRDHPFDTRVDFWQFPYETLQKGAGDCEDMSFLLASILMRLNLYYVRVVLGRLKGRGHAWVEVYDGYQWNLLDCTHKKMYPLSKRESLGYEVHYNIYHWGCTTPETTKPPLDFYLTFLVGIILVCFVISVAVILVLL